MNQQTENLIKMANNTQNTLLEIIGDYPSVDPSFLPIEDLFEAERNIIKTSHRIEIRGILSARIYQLGQDDPERAWLLARSTTDGLSLQLMATLHVAIMCSEELNVYLM